MLPVGMDVVDGGPLPAGLAAGSESPVQLLWRIAETATGGGTLVRPSDDAPFQRTSWSDIRDTVRRLAAGLVEAGIRPGDRVAIWGDTSVHWMLANHAILAAGAVVVPVYATLHKEQVAHVLRDSGAKAAFVDDALADSLPGPVGDAAELPTWRLSADGCFALELDDDCLAQQIDGLVAAASPDDVCTIIYTSGTTGVPKGVVLSNQNWGASTAINVTGLALDEIKDPSILAFLPLAHVAGYAAMLALTYVGGTLAFSRPDRMAKDFPAVRPTMLIAVPRLYERIIGKVHAAVAESSPIKQFLFRRAETIGQAYGKAIEDQGTAPPLLQIQHGFYDRLIYSKLRRKLGFDRVQVGLTGAAAVRPDLLYFLQGMGINVVEAFGMTETTGLVTTNLFHHFRAGTVGRPMAGTKAATAEDGELLIAGAMVFQSYWNLPAETEEAFTEVDGIRWLQTGDIARIDPDGFISIVDRKKELEVLDTGKMVAPLRVEELLKGASPLIEDSCVVGTDRKFAAALIQPSYAALIQWARSEGVEVDPAPDERRDPTGEMQVYGVAESFLDHPRIQALYERLLKPVNDRLADFEQVRRFTLVPTAFTIDRDELTPTFKKKRAKIKGNHASRIDTMYSRPAP